MLPPHSWNEVNDSQFNDCKEIRQIKLLLFGVPSQRDGVDRDGTIYKIKIRGVLHRGII